MAIIYMISVGVIGVIANFISMAIIIKNQTLHNTFGFLCFSHLVANIGILTCFCTWPVGMIISQNNDLAYNPVAKLFGQFTIIFWYSCLFGHLAISINRYISIVYPLKAMVFFTTKMTRRGIQALWIISILVTIPYFWGDSCYLIFNASTFQWTYSDTQCGQALSYFDFGAGVVICSIAFLIDMITLFDLHNVNSALGVTQGVRRRQNEIRLFTQAFIQCSIFCFTSFSFHVFTLISDNIWWQFTMVTMVWISAHSLDGLIVILFHYRSLFAQKVQTLPAITVSTQIQQITQSEVNT